MVKPLPFEKSLHECIPFMLSPPSTVEATAFPPHWSHDSSCRQKEVCVYCNQTDPIFQPDPKVLLENLHWSQPCHYCTLLSLNRLTKEEYGIMSLIAVDKVVETVSIYIKKYTNDNAQRTKYENKKE
jgi:hypothetical protein